MYIRRFIKERFVPFEKKQQKIYLGITGVLHHRLAQISSSIIYKERYIITLFNETINYLYTVLLEKVYFNSYRHLYKK